MQVFGQLKNAAFESILSSALPAASSHFYRTYYLTDLKTLVISDGTTWNTVGATIAVVEFKVNGPLIVATEFDGKHYLPYNAEILYVGASIRDTGTSGNSQLDLMTRTTPGGARSSLFSTKPNFTSAAADDNYVDAAGTTPPGTGVTAPVLVVGTLPAGSVLEFDILAAAANAADCGLTIHYRRI